MAYKIAFFDSKPYDQESFDASVLSGGFEIKYYPVRLNAETASLAKGADAVCAFVNDDLSAPVIDALLGLGVRLVALRCAGYNNVDLKSAYGRLHVVRVPAYSPYAVAEHAASLLLTLNRKIHRAYNRTREGNFTLNGLLGFDLHGKTAGVIGTGRIGKVAAEILKGFGMELLVHDLYPDAAWAAEKGMRYASLAEIYAESRVISLHCPLTPESRHMINDQSIRAMRDGVILINTGRGALVEAKALIGGLKSGKIGGAGLDVYEEEDKYFFEDFSHSGVADDVLARLLAFPNVLVTAHQAFFTEEAMSAIASATLENARAFFEDGDLPNEICYLCSTQADCPRKKTGKCF
jgi:D-lactate dehydrogenase